jgi:transposase
MTAKLLICIAGQPVFARFHLSGKRETGTTNAACALDRHTRLRLPHTRLRFAIAAKAELYYQQLDALRLVRQQARKELLAEAKKHRATKLLRQIPGIGPLRAAHLVAVMQTPHRFRTKRQLWTYSGLGLETHDSAQYRVVEQQLQRSKKSVTLRGLNTNHNHDLKDIFKGAAMRASTAAGPLHDFYEALLAKGRKPTMARLTLARKIAAITLIVGKKEVRFDANYLKQQAA